MITLSVDAWWREVQRMATVDVTVMGAGIFGLSVAYACAMRGAKVRVIDPNGVAAGASGGLVGALAPHVPENWNSKKQFQFESLCMAAKFWAEVGERAGSQTGYIQSGRLQPLANAHAVELATARTKTAKELWQGLAIWQVITAPEIKWAPPSETGLLIRDTLSALIHPRSATHSLAQAFLSLGGQICTSAPNEGRVIWATGWQGLEELSGQSHRMIGTGVKGQAILLDYDASGAPQLFADSLHIIPHLDGTTAIGSTSEREFDDAKQVDQQLEALHARAVAAMPVLRDAPVLERWAGVRPRSRSRAPMLGKHPFKRDEFVANGGFKIGFGMAPKVGEVMADLILDDRVTYPAEFDVSVNI
jgi:glycine oxidase